MKYTQRIDPKSVPQSESNKYTRGFPSNLLFSMSEFGDQIMVVDDGFIYILWNVEKPGHKELLSLNVKLSDIFNTAARISGIVTDIKCPWEQLNDELFEELCYDILYYNPTYDNSRIRKMGKSRSRDGGRDIEVYTQARPGYSSEKYIFQCKYLKTGVSLGASKVTDVSDKVIQYGAAGYGIMTNVVIDATLYDKMDGISANTNVKFVDYSIYQMERVLSRYPQIKARYFKN